MKTPDWLRQKSKGDVNVIRSVGDHVETHFGKIAWVMHEKESPGIHVDVYVVEATSGRNYKRLVTSGMSEKPMPVPTGAEDGRYAELTLCLPPSWPLSPEAFKEEANYWPVRVLKGVARHALQNDTWLYQGHSMPWSDSVQPFAENTAMTSILLLEPKLATPESRTIMLGRGNSARLWAIFPIYEVELEVQGARGL